MPYYSPNTLAVTSQRRSPLPNSGGSAKRMAATRPFGETQRTAGPADRGRGQQAHVGGMTDPGDLPVIFGELPRPSEKAGHVAARQ